RTVEGETTTGAIASLGAQELVLTTDQGAKPLAIQSLHSVARTPLGLTDSKADTRVELIGGSVLKGSQFKVQAKTAELRLANGATIKVPARSIANVRFGVEAPDAKLAKQWSDILTSEPAGDLLVVRKDGAIDYLEGILLEVDDETCRFELDKEVIPVKRSKVEGMVYFHTGQADVAEPAGIVIHQDGSRIAAAKLILDGELLKLTDVSGLTFDVPLDEVFVIDFSAGKIVYLSDFEPESASHVPFVGFTEEPEGLRDFYRYRRDQNFDHSALKLAGKTYRKGLALASRSTLTYKLPGKFRWLKCWAGIDETARETGDVHLRITGDGKPLWEGDVKGSEAPRELALEIAGAKRIEILVDYGAGLDVGDRLNLCDIRVTK
ncbi:MAG TPA: NPCBM/NEW2 domain-containing protein, partial [Pirellulales bacterium]